MAKKHQDTENYLDNPISDAKFSHDNKGSLGNGAISEYGQDGDITGFNHMTSISDKSSQPSDPPVATEDHVNPNRFNNTTRRKDSKKTSNIFQKITNFFRKIFSGIVNLLSKKNPEPPEQNKDYKASVFVTQDLGPFYKKNNQEYQEKQNSDRTTNLEKEINGYRSEKRSSNIFPRNGNGS